MRNKLICMLLAAIMVMSMAACGSTPAPAPTQEPEQNQTAEPAATPEATAEPAPEVLSYEMDATTSILLKATGMCTFSFPEEMDEDWADNVTAVYVREMPADPCATPLTDADKVDDAKYTVSTTKVILDSDIFNVAASTAVEYEVTIQSEGAEDYHISMTIQNLRPTEFVIRTIDGEGKVVDSYTLSYAEMEALCTTEGYYSAACVMHGLNQYHAKGVLLTDLLDKVGVEFTEGMSLAARVADAPATVEATEVNNGNKTGYVLENTEGYWVKPRYTDYYKLSYENLMGRDRYFISAPYDDAAMGEMLAADGANWTLDARVQLAESGLYEKVTPMIAIQYESFEYNTDPRDPRTDTDVVWELSANERGFCFLFGLAMDDDTAVNTTAYDNDLKEYPIVTTPETAGLTAFEEGPDACGTSARQAKLVCGIDIFLEGGLA